MHDIAQTNSGCISSRNILSACRRLKAHLHHGLSGVFPIIYKLNLVISPVKITAISAALPVRTQMDFFFLDIGSRGKKVINNSIP